MLLIQKKTNIIKISLVVLVVHLVNPRLEEADSDQIQEVLAPVDSEIMQEEASALAVSDLILEALAQVDLEIVPAAALVASVVIIIIIKEAVSLVILEASSAAETMTITTILVLHLISVVLVKVTKIKRNHPRRVMMIPKRNPKKRLLKKRKAHHLHLVQQLVDCLVQIIIVRACSQVLQAYLVEVTKKKVEACSLIHPRRKVMRRAMPKKLRRIKVKIE
mmetsp:Transcript_13828/g.11794  ORF Transcript_13828/g.11794 Transcript_13828/m.11794 type:complete len:220 (+) Transcript_13828:1604-2263(+)